MRASLLAAAMVGMLFPGLWSVAQGTDQDQGLLDARFTGRGQIGNQKPFFVMAMPVATFRQAPALDLANPKLPKPLKEIVDVAFAQLEKSLGTRKGWTLGGVRMLKVTGIPEFKGRWCYIVTFTDGAWGHAQFPVTVDGRLGTLLDAKTAPRNEGGVYSPD